MKREITRLTLQVAELLKRLPAAVINPVDVDNFSRSTRRRFSADARLVLPSSGCSALALRVQLRFEQEGESR